MTPAELRELAATMRELGIFKLTIGDTVIEMSQTALALAHAPTIPAPPSQEADGPSPQDPRKRAEDVDDPMLYAATEGMPA